MKIAEFEESIVPDLNEEAKKLFASQSVKNKRIIIKWYEDPNSINTGLDIEGMNIIVKDELIRVKNMNSNRGGSRRRRRPSRKYKKSAKRVFRKKSRSTRRR
jgi:hypothetical protein